MVKILEYIWIGGRNEIRSKTRVLEMDTFLPPSSEFFPEWNYDGSSTWQADSNLDTEVVLKPCAIFQNPLRKIDGVQSYLVLCDTYLPNGEKLNTNTRFDAAALFEKYSDEHAWFGLEQEYFIRFHKSSGVRTEEYHYCGSCGNNEEREIAEAHLQACLRAGLKVSGINAEVVDRQWEFQIGPCEGIEAGDHMIIARYLLERIAEKHNASIQYEPKPYHDSNGSGCHINFSTENTRKEDGIEYIHKYIAKLSKKHKEHLDVYGENNHLRLTGKHETSSMDKFSWGVGTRNTSIRVPNQAVKDGRGYFEDRRPAANIDPYLATAILLKTCVQQEQEQEQE